MNHHGAGIADDGRRPVLLSALLNELQMLHDKKRNRINTMMNPNRRAAGVDIVDPAADGRDQARMELLRQSIISELRTQEQLGSPYAAEVFPPPSETTLSLSLPIGERSRPLERLFGKRVFQQRTTALSPTAAQRRPESSDHQTARFSKRMNIEAEAKRRALDIDASSGRQPEKESIFSARYAQLRDGILGVDSRKACIRFPPVPPRRRQITRIAAESSATTSDDRIRQTEYMRNFGASSPRSFPDAPRLGPYYALPAPPSALREVVTAVGQVIPTTPRHLLSPREAPHRPLSQTRCSAAESL